MNVLIMRNDTEILAWLISEDLASVDDHIKNGYPHLETAHLSGALKTEIISAPDELFHKTIAAVDSFEIAAGKVQKKLAAI